MRNTCASHGNSITSYVSCTVAHRGSTKISIPVQKYLSQYKNIYPSTKIFIPVQKYLSQYKNIYLKTTIFIPVQKYLSQYQNIYPKTKIFFHYKNIYPRTKIFFQYKNYFYPSTCTSSATFFPCCIAPLVKFPPKQDGRFVVW